MQSTLTAHWLPKVAIGLCLAVLVLLTWDLEYQGTRLIQMVPFPSKDKVVSDVNPNDTTEETISYKEVDPGVLQQTDESSVMDRFTNDAELFGITPAEDLDSDEYVRYTSVNADGSVRYIIKKIKPMPTSNKTVASSVALNTTTPAPITIPQDFKVILLWTTYKGRRSWWWLRGQLGRKPFMDENCPISTCVLIDDHSLIDRADMLLFFYHDPLNWPPVRYPHQQYVHAMVERPTAGQDWMKEYDNKFNLTMNYRQDADITQHLHGIQQVDPVRPGPYIPMIALHSKTRSVVWPVSHCGVDSKRDDYAAELGKYIDLDIYGGCGNLTCLSREKWRCFRMFETKYKFYLSFENAICQDYVTEKLYNPLKFELIPIVLGGGDYARVAPPHSYIDVRDFKSPKLLAEYLHNLGQNETQYASYFQWKQSYDIVGDTGRYCKLCEAVHDPSLRQPAKPHYYDWWFNKCDNELVNRMKENW